MVLKGKTVVVTGASSGIGAAAAIEFAKKGANLVLVARSEKLAKLEENLSKFNIETLSCKCDVSDKLQVSDMAKTTLAKFDKVDVLVNNAGFAVHGSVLEQEIQEIEAQMATNYFGMIYCIKEFLPKMLKQRSGHIVNVASVAASFGLPGIAPYCATKFAMLGLSEGLKYELEGTGVGVTVVSPIMVRTPFFDHPSFVSPPKGSLSLSAQTVAKTIVKATYSSRLEIVVPFVARGAIWAKHTIPFVVKPLIGNSFKKYLNSRKDYSGSSAATSKSSRLSNSN